MTTAFIIRPFGKQKTRMRDQPIEIDFDKVERELIDPVLTRLGITGRTTGEIVEAGNIRDDMFRRLLTCELVIADLTVHNANVFYELGIRHALRDKKTFQIRGKGDPTPFDNLTDRYFEYDLNDPSASVDKLAEAIKRTIDSESSDSPVFRSIPDLQAPDVGLFITVPSGFGKECELAYEAGRVGVLLLLASEAKGFHWEIAGLRAVGRALFNIKAWPAARDTWEAIREWLPEDREANEWLATIYQRLSEKAKSDEERSADLTRSNQAIRTVLAIEDLPMRLRAEHYALIGRNEKSQWLAEWKDRGEGKREAALGSSFLIRSFEGYADGFDVDLNHFYSGLNAAAMLTILTSLAGELPDVWSSMHRSDREAGEVLEQYRGRLAELLSAVKLSLAPKRKRMQAEDREGIWFEISLADFHCLTLKGRPGAVAQSYRNAMAKAKDFHREAAAKQLLLYQELGLMTDNVGAALDVIKPPGRTVSTETPPRTLLFTGHRIDDPGRATPRFPSSKEAEARRAIAAAVDAEIASAASDRRKVIGIAGGASGGDILFHEVCRERGVDSAVYLVMPREDFIGESVAPAGPGWVDRFNRLAAALSTGVLGASDELPVWLRQKPNYTIWDRSNLWMLHNALVNGGENATVIALWDGQPGDGPGGTEHMVEEAEDLGAKVIRLDTKALFGL
jgi:hypothetical protein